MDLQLNGLGAVLQVAALSIWDNFQERILDEICFCKVARFRVHYICFFPGNLQKIFRIVQRIRYMKRELNSWP